jgi:hypothetical protein
MHFLLGCKSLGISPYNPPRSYRNGLPLMRRLPPFRHHPGRHLEAPGFCRRCPEISDTIRPGIGQNSHDGTDEIVGQGRAGQNKGNPGTQAAKCGCRNRRGKNHDSFYAKYTIAASER